MGRRARVPELEKGIGGANRNREGNTLDNRKLIKQLIEETGMKRERDLGIPLEIPALVLVRPIHESTFRQNSIVRN